jgi:hypothetical protein
MKSLGINFACLLLFFLPMVIYLYRDISKESGAVVAVSLVAAYFLPPVGWKRPHPYSDNPNNLPWVKKSE